MDDSILNNCNETELLQLARKQGLGVLRRGLPHELLVSLVAGYAPMRDDYLAGTTHTRSHLARHINENIERARSQLPGCTGDCSTYPCSEGRHGMCILPKMREV